MSSIDPNPVIESSITVDVPPPTNHVHDPSFYISTEPNMSSSATDDIIPVSSISDVEDSAMSSFTVDVPTSAATTYNIIDGKRAQFPGRALKLTIIALLALLGIKAQGNTNPWAMKVSVCSVILFALASGVEHVFSLVRPARTSNSAIVAHWARIVSLGFFVGSLAWPLLF
ncbi:hypothetical protein OSB04_029821 [Centaurea solstitialis]|uniref:Uncharacterized protein n=1 Tax=Centaurea solstitialis TaxID=347529 RepID=A0AA38S787_9ASTR|nr:hypothetical protein OSB04_029821 [Centaurea solstitialis]